MATRLAGPTLSKVTEMPSALTLVSSAKTLTVNGTSRLGPTLALFVAAEPSARSGTSAALTRNWLFCTLKENGSTTLAPASIPSIVQPKAAFSTQAASAGFALLSIFFTLADVTLPALPMSTVTSTIPAASRRSASTFSKQRYTSVPCFCRAFSMTCATCRASPGFALGCACATPTIAQQSAPAAKADDVLHLLVGFLKALS